MFARNHVSDEQRLQIGLLIFQNQGHYGVVTQEAKAYGVSRWFIYWCHHQLLEFLIFWKIWLAEGTPVLAQVRSVEEMIMSLYVEPQSSLSGIKHSLKTLFGVSFSMGGVSEVFQDYGRRLPAEDSLEKGCYRFICDECFTKNCPILVTVEPKSGTILQLRLEEQRNAATWSKDWQILIKNNEESVQQVVSDQAKGIIAAVKETLPKASYQADHWHLLNPLKQRLRSLERQAYAAIKREYETLKKYELFSTEEEKTVLRTIYESDCQESLRAIIRYEGADYLLKFMKSYFFGKTPCRMNWE